jgi:ubiquinone/menaquinone biosynthesis C-methylase UbiE
VTFAVEAEDRTRTWRRRQAETAKHYDTHPLNFLTPADEIAIREMQPGPFRRFVESHWVDGGRVAEIGCGPGRGTLFLERQNRFEIAAVDVSGRSLRLARARAPAAMFIQASNLALPFADGSFDLVVSDGVIHHTPDARVSFAENVRIAKRGGLIYLAVYKRHRHYYYVYRFLGPCFRRLEQSSLGRALLFMSCVPLYWLVHLLKSRGRRTWAGAVNFFYDYIITPNATFHTREEICRWAREEGLGLVEYDAYCGNVHVFVFAKGRAHSAAARDARLRHTDQAVPCHCSAS